MTDTIFREWLLEHYPEHADRRLFLSDDDIVSGRFRAFFFCRDDCLEGAAQVYDQMMEIAEAYWKHRGYPDHDDDIEQPEDGA